MKRNIMVLLVAFVLFLPVFASADVPARVVGNPSAHSSHGFFSPRSGFNLLGGVYNPTSEDWSWYMGAKTVFFHPANGIWVGGIGFGVAFNQSEKNGHNLPVLTFVSIQIGAFALETSFKKVSAVTPKGEHKRSRLVMLTWNWTF